MKKFSGIYMGRKKKQISEIEAEMKGSSDDIEPWGLAILAQEFCKYITLTESKLVTHLQENHEENSRGKAKINDTLRKVDENQKIIVELLMGMNHKGKGP
jgi:hypothetical protein